ncbi:MAG: hypothetical protein CV087_23045 [Candidatus Brocadia sp. WS118]|nr:MAG: hypothetical protein CV087_23045 [Candidatus Brocadia sp. WS118]
MNTLSNHFLLSPLPIVPFLVVLLVVLCAPPLPAQSPAFRHYTTDNGLPSSETYDILQDDQGYIWIATDNGLSRFNGYEFENFGPEQGLLDNTVFKIYKDYRGRLWFCTISVSLRRRASCPPAQGQLTLPVSSSRLFIPMLASSSAGRVRGVGWLYDRRCG